MPSVDCFWRCAIDSISPHTHNTFLLRCRFPVGNFLSPPAGAHVFLRRQITSGKGGGGKGGGGGAGGGKGGEGGGGGGKGSSGVQSDDDGKDKKLVSRPYTPIHPSFHDVGDENDDENDVEVKTTTEDGKRLRQHDDILGKFIHDK